MTDAQIMHGFVYLMVFAFLAIGVGLFTIVREGQHKDHPKH